MIDGTSSSDTMPMHATNETLLYPEGYENPVQYSLPNTPTEAEPVVVPESFHISQHKAPVKAKDMDERWVMSQNPSYYTIELAEGAHAAQVANVLYQAPKNERSAEINGKRQGQAYYQGVYGSYANEAEAQEHINTLPNDLKQNAHIKRWSTIQKEVE